MSTSYRVKYVDAAGRDDRLPILCHGVNEDEDGASGSYSSIFLALVNSLLIRNDGFRLPRYGVDAVLHEDLSSAVAEWAFETSPPADVENCFAGLMSLVGTGGGDRFVADPLFTEGVTGFDKTADNEANSAFRALGMLGVELLNGWLVDPADDGSRSQMKTMSHSVLLKEVAGMRDVASRADQMEDELDELRALALSNGEDENDVMNTPEWVKLSEDLGDSRRTLAMQDKQFRIFETFLEKGAASRGLTSHGVKMLKNHVQEGSVSVLYRHGRFHTLTNHGGELFTLKTAMDNFHEEGLVWESLEKKGEFVDGSFRPSPSRPGDRPVGSFPSHPRDRGIAGVDPDGALSDFELAMRLQSQESQYAMEENIHQSTFDSTPVGESTNDEKEEPHDERWKVKMAVAAEIRSKVGSQKYLTIDDAEAESWEDWTRAANSIRAHRGDVRNGIGLPPGIAEEVRQECISIIQGDVPIIASSEMYEAALEMATEEVLLRSEEHSFLLELIDMPHLDDSANGQSSRVGRTEDRTQSTLTDSSKPPSSAGAEEDSHVREKRNNGLGFHITRCQYCNKSSDDLKPCSYGCKSAAYCGLDCERQHRRKHRKLCKHVSETECDIFQCPHCKEVSEDLLLCKRCISVAYCGRKCQARHYKSHRNQCREIANKWQRK